MKGARIRVDNVSPGPFKSERAVSFRAGDITYALLVDAEDVQGDTLGVHVIGEFNGEVLVDLPRETINSGRRVRLPKSLLVA